MENCKVPAEKLRAFCTKEEFQVDAELEAEDDGIIGQHRALKALEFGLGIQSKGFNIYVAGVPGTGKETAVKEYVEKVARDAGSPGDLCYVNNFRDPYRPCILTLPKETGIEFAREVKNLINTARQEIPRALESDEYVSQKENITRQYNERKQELFNRLNEKAHEQGFMIQQSPSGFLIIPKKEDGSPMQENDLMSLSEEERKAIYEKRNVLEDELKATMREVKHIDRKASEDIKELDQKVILFSVEHLFNELLEKYKDQEEVTEYLKAMQEDVVENGDLFRHEVESKQEQVPFASTGASMGAMGVPWSQAPQFKKYEVNVIVDNSGVEGAPVVMEMNPTYYNVFGRIEKEAQFGALVTDFTMIKGGSLHQANGGFFVVSVEDLLKNLFTWESLKRVLKNQELEIEEAGERLGFMSAQSLRPEPVTLDVKVVLIGPPHLYYLLHRFDPEFQELFKVKAEFDVTMDRKPENVKNYSAFISTFCQKEQLVQLDDSALARVVEYGSRLAEDQNKLSTRFAEIADVIREACYYAYCGGLKEVSSSHIARAIEAHIYRSNLIQEKIQEMMEKDQLLIDTEEKKVGQINGLTVFNAGDFSFGKPTRITCSIGMGRGGIIDIEREAKLGGRLHTKGVMILAGLLSSRYAGDMPLSLSARLVFEQSYSEVDGDSASSTEFYALLSALSGLPLKQDLAVTGSVNQKGEVQAIGGVNEKVEGFYEICKSRGLNGEQGVIIPRSNVQNLMLKEEVVETVEKGNFHVYAVSNVDEALEILTGVKAGERKENGSYEAGSVNDMVQKALRSYAEKMKGYREEKSRREAKEENGEEQKEE